MIDIWTNVVGRGRGYRKCIGVYECDGDMANFPKTLELVMFSTKSIVQDPEWGLTEIWKVNRHDSVNVLAPLLNVGKVGGFLLLIGDVGTLARKVRFQDHLRNG